MIQFPPSYGCASWQVLDFDGDGNLDLLIANGDNGDYKSKPKAYHGLRLYQGDGRGHFTERWSYPMNGAFGVYAADFDGDGNLDIAAISFFPDYKEYPDENFVYLKNIGNWNFQPFVLPETQQGRWLVMDAGDIDGDGDIDIVCSDRFLTDPTRPTFPMNYFRSGKPIVFRAHDSGEHHAMKR